MFERFTVKAIKVIMLAQEEARRLGHNFVGTEQILLGLIGEGTGSAAKSLKSMGVNIKDARIEVEKLIGRGSGFTSVEIPFTPNAKRLLESSWSAARELSVNYIETEQLLLGLLKLDDCKGLLVLDKLNVDRENLRKALISSIPSNVNPNKSATENCKENKAYVYPQLKDVAPDPAQDIFAKFTEKAIKVIMLGQEESRRLGHNFLGTEQILLGLIGEGTGIAAKSLKSTGINLKDARQEVEKIIGRGSGFVAIEIPFTPRAKRVIEYAQDEASQLGHNYIGTEHLLLGLIREGEGVAARVMENLGLDPSKVRGHVIRLMGVMGIQNEDTPAHKERKDKAEKWDQATMDNLISLLFPTGARQLAHQLADICSEKILAIKNQEFNRAASLKEQEENLAEQLKKLTLGTSKSSIEDPELLVIDKLSDGVLKVILLAREECRRLGYNTLGSEQILLGLISEGAGITNKVFQSAGIDLEKARDAVYKITGKDSNTKATYISITPRAKKILKEAQNIAKQYGLIYIKKEHLLLALLSEGEGVAVATLRNLGVNIDKIKDEIKMLLNEQSQSD